MVFLTDGAVSADDTAISKIAGKRGDARIFTFGIGPAVNRYLLRKLAQVGRGVSEFISAKDDIETAMTRFQDRISYPALTDLALTWDGAETWDTYPDPLPDLYVGQPLEIVTRLKRKTDTMLRFAGRADGQPVTLSMPIAAAVTSDPTLRRIHARARIEALMDSLTSGGDAEKVRSQVISLGIEHRLATAYTSFVAVDSEIVDKSDGQTVQVAVPLPEGLDLESFGGGLPPALAYVGHNLASSPAPMRMMAMSAPMVSMPADTNVDEDDNTMGIVPTPKQRNLMDSLRKSVAGKGRRRGTPTPDANAPPDMELERDITFDPASTLEDGLKSLARTQRVNGSWDDSAEHTAAALLTFVRAEHTTREGNYRVQVGKAAKWLSGQLATLSGIVLFVAIRALDELRGASGDYGISDAVRAKLPQPTTDIERAVKGGSVSLPDKMNSLDVLRIAALNGTLEDVANVTLSGGDIMTGAFWRMVGKPK